MSETSMEFLRFLKAVKLRLDLKSIILALIVLMFLFDGLNSVLHNLDSPVENTSIYIRSIAEAFFLLLLLRTDKRTNIWSILVIFNLVFLIGSLAGMFSLYPASESNLFENFRILNKTMFVFITFETLRIYFSTLDQREKLFKILEILILVQAVVIIISFIFHIQLFSAYLSYTADGVRIKRFGYQGLIPAQNEVAGFFLIGFYYFLLKFAYYRKGLILLLITIVAGLMTGTKVALLFPIVLTLFLVWRAYKQVNTHRLSRKLLGLLVLFLFLVSIAIWQREYIIKELTPTINYYVRQSAIDQSNPILTAFTVPGRVLKIQEFFSSYLPRFNGLNFLFGGHDLTSFATESDPFDIFAKLGILGTLAFYLIYIQLLLYPGNRPTIFRLVFIISWLGVSLVAGHLAYTAINGTYLALLILFFDSLERQESNYAAQTILNPGISRQAI